MENYDPLRAPDTGEWLAFDESERIGMVESFHLEAEEELTEGSETLHAVIHVVVENQIALGAESVPETIEKLMRQGLDRHEAIHAIGAVLAEEMFDLLQGDESSYASKRYQRRLKKLTAKRWRKGRW